MFDVILVCFLKSKIGPAITEWLFSYVAEDQSLIILNCNVLKHFYYFNVRMNGCHLEMLFLVDLLDWVWEEIESNRLLQSL